MANACSPMLGFQSFTMFVGQQATTHTGHTQEKGNTGQLLPGNVKYHKNFASLFTPAQAQLATANKQPQPQAKAMSNAHVNSHQLPSTTSLSKPVNTKCQQPAQNYCHHHTHTNVNVSQWPHTITKYTSKVRGGEGGGCRERER